MSVIARLQVPSGEQVAPGATVTVRLLDVGRADAASTVVDEQVVVFEPSTEVRRQQGFDVHLTLPADADPSATWAIFAHVDSDGSGDVSTGDLLTTSHVGVGRAHDGRVVDVPLTRLG